VITCRGDDPLIAFWKKLPNNNEKYKINHKDA